MKQVFLPKKLIEIGIFALPFFVAILYTTITENCNLIKTLLFRFILLFLVFLWGSIWLETRKIKLAYGPLNRPILAFLIIITIRAVLTSYHYISLYELSIFICYILLYFLVLNFVDDMHKMRRIVNALLIIFSLVSIYGIFQYFGIDFINWKGKEVLSSFGNPNFFAAYLVLFIPIILSSFLNTPTLSYKLAYGALLLIAGSCLIGTMTRGAWIGFFISLIVFTPVYLLVGQKKGFRRKLNGSLLLLATILLAFSFAISSKSVALRARSIFDFGKDPSGAVRIIIWKGATKAFLDRPLVGRGIGSFRIVFPEYRTPQHYKTGIGQYTLHAHSEYLEWLVDGGIVGLGVFLWVLTAFFRESFRLSRSGNRFIQTLSLGITSGMAGLLGHNMLSVNLRWTVCGFFFWLMIALTASMYRINNKTKNSQKGRKATGAKSQNYETRLSFTKPIKFVYYPVFFMILIFAGIFETKQFLAEKYLHMGKDYIEVEDWDKATDYLRSAIKQNQYLLAAYYQLGHAYNMKELYQLSLGTYQKLIQLHPNYARANYNLGCVRMNMKDWQGALTEFEQAVALEDSPANHAKLAEVYMQLGNHKAMEKEYKKTVELDPDYLIIYEVMAMQYLKEGKLNKAETEFKKIIVKSPSDKEAHFHLGRLYEQQGKWQKSITEYEKVIALDPKDSRAHNNLGSIYLHLDRIDLSLAELKKAIAVNPKDILAHFNLGRALLKQGKREDAFLNFGKVIQMDPESWIAGEAARILTSPVLEGEKRP